MQPGRNEGLEIYNKNVAKMLELDGENGISRYCKKRDAWSMVYKSTPENATIKVYVREVCMAKAESINKVQVGTEWKHKLPELCCGR